MAGLGSPGSACRRRRRLGAVGVSGSLLLVLLSQVVGHKQPEERRSRDVLASTEIPADSIDPAAIDLAPLVNTLINSTQSGPLQLFSLLSVTSYSSLQLHKLTLLIYNISSVSVEGALFQRRFCYCVSNKTNGLTDFTAILLDVMSNSSYLHEIFKSTSILSVSQKNDTDCIYICVMAGQTDRELPQLWDSALITPLFNQTIIEDPHRSGNLSFHHGFSAWQQLSTNISQTSPSGPSGALTSRVHLQGSATTAVSSPTSEQIPSSPPGDAATTYAWMTDRLTPDPGTPVSMTTTTAVGSPETTADPGTPVSMTTTGTVGSPGTPVSMTTTTAVRSPETTADPRTPVSMTTTGTIGSPGTAVSMTTTTAVVRSPETTADPGMPVSMTTSAAGVRSPETTADPGTPVSMATTTAVRSPETTADPGTTVSMTTTTAVRSPATTADPATLVSVTTTAAIGSPATTADPGMPVSVTTTAAAVRSPETTTDPGTPVSVTTTGAVGSPVTTTDPGTPVSVTTTGAVGSPETTADPGMPVSMTTTTPLTSEQRGIITTTARRQPTLATAPPITTERPTLAPPLSTVTSSHTAFTFPPTVRPGQLTTAGTPPTTSQKTTSTSTTNAQQVSTSIHQTHTSTLGAPREATTHAGPTVGVQQEVTSSPRRTSVVNLLPVGVAVDSTATTAAAPATEKPGCPWRRPSDAPPGVPAGSGAPWTTVGAHKLQPCLLELCKFFSQCLCRPNHSKTPPKRYCDDSDLWYRTHTPELCSRLKRVSFSRNLKQRCLAKMCGRP